MSHEERRHHHHAKVDEVIVFHGAGRKSDYVYKGWIATEEPCGGLLVSPFPDRDPQGSGDFSRQAAEPQPLDIEAMVEHSVEGALNDAELAGMTWDRLPLQLAEFALDILVAQFIEKGHHAMTVREMGVLLGVCHVDGSWV